MANILGFSLFKLGDLVDSRVGFFVLLGDAILTLVGDVIFNNSFIFLYGFGCLPGLLFAASSSSSCLFSTFCLVLACFLVLLANPWSSTRIMRTILSVALHSSCHTFGFKVLFLLQLLLSSVLLLVLAGGGDDDDDGPLWQAVGFDWQTCLVT